MPLTLLLARRPSTPAPPPVVVPVTSSVAVLRPTLRVRLWRYDETKAGGGSTVPATYYNTAALETAIDAATNKKLRERLLSR